MIKSYKDFINESFEFLLESNVIYSDKFKNILNKINSELSTTLLKLENEDLPVRSNFFDVVDNTNDKLSFIPDARAQEFLNAKNKYYKYIGTSGGWLKHSTANKGIFDKLGYIPTGDEPQHVRFDIGKEISQTKTNRDRTYIYIEFENGGKGVFNVSKLESVNPNKDKVWSHNRQEIRVGRAIKALLDTTTNDKFTVKDIEEFVNSFKATIDKMNDIFSEFEEVNGDKIAYWYDSTNYYQIKGTLGNSCMSRVDSRYFDLYVKNPEVCSLVILKSVHDEKKLAGRALLWTLPNGRKFMDRIYVTNDSDFTLFKDYAKSNGWYSKKYNDSSATPVVIDINGKFLDLNEIKINIKKDYLYEGYPYVDTVKFIDFGKWTLSTQSTNDTFDLESTGGYVFCKTCGGEGQIRCEFCHGNGWVNGQSCTDCDGDGCVPCPTCRGNGYLNKTQLKEYLKDTKSPEQTIGEID